MKKYFVDCKCITKKLPRKNRRETENVYKKTKLCPFSLFSADICFKTH